jgi:hypothetical protein
MEDLADIFTRLRIQKDEVPVKPVIHEEWVAILVMGSGKTYGYSFGCSIILP